MVSQNMAIPIQEQLDALLNPNWDEEIHKSICIEEVLWTTAHWITKDVPEIVTIQFASTVLHRLEPYIEEWDTALKKVTLICLYNSL